MQHQFLVLCIYFRRFPLIENIRNCDSQLIAKYHHRVDSRNYFTSQEITYRRGRQPKISGDLVGCCSSLLTQLFKSTSYFHTFFFGVIHIHLPPLSYIQVSIMYMAGIDRILQTFLRKLSRELIALVTSTATLQKKNCTTNFCFALFQSIAYCSIMLYIFFAEGIW